MNNLWVRAGVGAPVHWVKLAGGAYFTTACQAIIAKSSAVRVPTMQVAAANAPGVYWDKPANGDVCVECERKAQVQA